MTAHKKFTLPLACVLACCLLAACGSSSSSSSSSAAASGSAASATATRTKFVACLKQHGVTLPNRAGGFFGRRPGSGTAPPYGGGSGSASGSGTSGSGTSGSGGAGSGTSGPGAPGSGGPGSAAGGGAPGAGGIFGGGGGGFRRRFQANPKLQAAFKACAADLPATRFRHFNPAARRTEITNFIKCVRQHGYNLPQPNFSGGPVFPSKIETSAKFQAASKACAHLLIPAGAPQGPGGGAPGSGTAGGLPQSS